MRQTFNIAKVYSPPKEGEMDEALGSFHAVHSEPTNARTCQPSDNTEQVRAIKDEFDLEAALRISPRASSCREPGTKLSRAMAKSSHDDGKLSSIPSAPTLVHQVSVLDFVRPAQPVAGGLKLNCSHLRFSVRKRLLFYLLLLGTLAGAIDLGIRVVIERISKIRENFTNDQENDALAFTIWAASALFLTWFAVGWTAAIEPAAVGSGLPQIKAILSGTEISGYLTVKMFFAKVGGLIAAASSGLSIGREGPFVHITAIISHQILRIPFFSEFMNRKSHRLQLIATAAAVGVSANFAAPIGGVLFSIEVTATYYLLDNYWKSFVSSIAGSLVATLLRVAFLGSEGFEQIFQTEFPLAPYQSSELPFFVLLGICMGILGGISIRLFSFYSRCLNKPIYGYGQQVRKWGIPAIVSLATASVTFWSGRFMTCALTECIDTLVSENDLPPEWSELNVFLSLFIFGSVYFILTPFSILLPVPAGVFIPAFATGAASGRILGIFLQDYVFSESTVIFPGAYALAGGAAMGAGLTRTMSSAVIALEFTGQQNLILPVFLCVIPAYGIGELISKGLFDAILISQDLPYLPINRYSERLTVGGVMDSHVLKLTKNTTYTRILLVINLMHRRTVPVVNDDKNLLLLGAVSKDRLMSLIRRHYARHNLPNCEQDMGSPSTGGVTASPDSTNHSYIRRSLATFKSVFNETDSVGSNHGSYHQSWIPNNLQALQNEENLMTFMTDYWDQSKRDIMNTEVCILEALGKNVLTPTVLTVPKDTHLEEVHIIFVMMRCQKLYVTHQGALCGEVTTEHMARQAT